MNKIRQKIAELRRCGKKALVAYITAGYPDSAATERAVALLEEAGVDMIELGMPFSDPIADGPTIQHASVTALRRGMCLRRYLALVRRVRRRSSVPLIMMTYYNPVLRYGLKRFSRNAHRAGLDGVIVPDLPREEAAPLRRQLRSCGLDMILLVSPLTGVSRSRSIARQSDGFVYYVSLTGVTGARKSLPPDMRRNVRRLRRVSTRPVFVGFGISSPAQVRAVARDADGVIVGSALVKLLEPDMRGVAKKRMQTFIRSLNRMTLGQRT